MSLVRMSRESRAAAELTPAGSSRRGPASAGLTRRAFLAALGAAAASTGLAACSVAGLPGRSGQSKAPVQLVYQDWRTDWFPPMARQMLEQFHSAHPNIRVFYTPDPEALEEKMVAAMQAGTAPDVFQGCCSFYPIWAQKGYCLDLRKYAAADLKQEDVADWAQAQYRGFFTRDGAQYALPKYHGALALYYNKDLCDEYGVKYPDESWTYDDYLSAMKHLTHDRDKNGQTDLWGSMIDIAWERLQIHVNGWGGHFVDPGDPNRCRMSDPEALAALEWVRQRMWRDNVMATPSDVRKVETRHAFISHRIAMVEDGSWALKDILAGADFRVGVAPFPKAPVKRATLATNDGFSIYSGTKHPDAAWELMKFLVSKDYGRAMAKAHFLQPARASLVEEWVRFIREEFPEKAKDVDIAAFAHGHLNGYSVTTEAFATHQEDAKRFAYAAWDQIFTLGLGTVDLMKNVCRQLQEVQRGGR